MHMMDADDGCCFVMHGMSAMAPPQEMLCTPPRTPRRGDGSAPHTPRTPPSQLGSTLLCPKTPMQIRSPNTSRLFSPCGEPLDNVSQLSKSFDHDPIASGGSHGCSSEPHEHVPIVNNLKKFSNKVRAGAPHSCSPAVSLHSMASVLGSSGPGLGITPLGYDEASPFAGMARIGMIHPAMDIFSCRYDNEFTNHIDVEQTDTVVVSVAQHIADKATYTIRRLQRSAMKDPSEVPELLAVAGAETEHIPRYYYSWVDPGSVPFFGAPPPGGEQGSLCIQLEDVCNALEVIGEHKRPAAAALPELLHQICLALDDAHQRNICFGPVQSGDIRLIGPTRDTAVWKLCSWSRSYVSASALHKQDDVRGLGRFLRRVLPKGADPTLTALVNDLVHEKSRYTAENLVYVTSSLIC